VVVIFTNFLIAEKICNCNGRSEHMLVLSSSGLNPQLIDHLKIKNNNLKSACIVTTAAIPEKENNRWAISNAKILKDAGLTEIKFIDFENDNIESIENFDITIILGGNPFYLFYFAQKSGAYEILQNAYNKQKIIMGISAAAFLLTTGMEYVPVYNTFFNEDPQKGNTIDLLNLKGIGLSDDILFPHYDKFSAMVYNLEEKISLIEQKSAIKITRLRENDVIIYEDGKRIQWSND
jgi:dipeptidase E